MPIPEVENATGETPVGHMGKMPMLQRNRLVTDRCALTRAVGGGDNAAIAMDSGDQQLVQRALGGEGGAFTALHAAHAGRVRAYLLRSGFASSDADDLAQEVFLRVFRSLETYDGERGPFAAWLGAVARNVVRRHWARRSRGELFDPELAEDMFPAEENPGNSPEALEEMEAVRCCVDALPSELARLVRLRYVEGRTTRGVAEAAGMPESTVRARLTEARDLLARCLREKGFPD